MTRQQIVLIIAGLIMAIAATYAQKPGSLPDKDTVRVLDSVTVTARKPLVTRKADRSVINIEGSFLANGFSAFEVLQRSPGLWVSPSGSIRINGGQSVTVMINDVVQRMSSAELAEYLKSLRSEQVSKIEVIPNPPSEYEASSSGGIVHIILKKAKMQGLTGFVGAQYKQQVQDPVYGFSASADYKSGNFYAFGGYNYSKDISHYTVNSSTWYPDASSVQNKGTRDNNNTRHQYRSGLVYDISKAQTLSLQHTGTLNQLVQQFYSAIQYQLPKGTGVGESNTDWLRKPWFSSTTLSYSWNTDTAGSFLKFIADYARNSKQESNTLVTAYTDADMNNTFRTHTPSSTDLYSVQTDYAQVAGAKSIVKAGLKYVYTSRQNTILAEDETAGAWVKNPAASDDFRYSEKLMMAYSSFETKIGRTSIKGGLRAEQTISKGLSIITGESINRNYFSLFPSLFLDHAIEEKKGNSVHLNYSRRIKRPAYNDLNPYRLQASDFGVLTGNPNLQPQFTHSIQAGYTWHREYTVDVYFRYNSNFIALTASTVGERIIENMSKNFPRNIETGISISAPFTPAKGWRADNNLMVFHAYSDLNEQQIRRTSMSFRTTHTYEWKKVADFDMGLEYNSPYTTGNGRMASYFYTDFGVARNILNKKGRLRFYVTDLFNTAREKEFTEYNNTRIDFYQKRPTRTFSISFIWRFNAGKVFTKKKIDPNNSEEKSRMGGN